jgi:hypothetical protein
MNQYQYTPKQVPALLKKFDSDSSVKTLNTDLMEMVINGNRVVVPTAEAYSRLVAKVARLEQRMYNSENKASRALRKANE